MRFRQWLTPKLASLARAALAYRVTPRSVRVLVFGCACWLLWSGAATFSPGAANIALSLLLLLALATKGGG